MSSTAALIMPVLDPNLKVLDRTLLMDLRGCDTHLLAEQLPQLVGDQTVVHTDRAHLRAPATEGTTIRQFRESGHEVPVQIDVVTAEPCEDFSAGGKVLFRDLPKNIRAERRPINIFSPAHLEDGAGIARRSGTWHNIPVTASGCRKVQLFSVVSSFSSLPEKLRPASSSSGVWGFGRLSALTPSRECSHPVSGLRLVR